MSPTAVTPRRLSAVAWLLALVVLTIVAVIAGRGPGASGSALSRAPGGWLGLRAVLEAWGEEVELLDVPLTETEAGGVLILAFPWQRAVTADDLAALDRHLRAGGTVVAGYSGHFLQPDEERVLDALGIETTAPRWPTIVPWRWRDDRGATWSARPEPPLAGNRPLLLRAPRVLPVPPADARILYRGGPEEVPLVFVRARGRGRVLVLPADVWSNARLAEPGNADLLATVRGRLDTPWRLDEYHHGLIDPARAQEELAAFVVLDLGFVRLTFWDLLGLHLGALYLLALVALGRPFGPAWREPPPAAAGIAGFLRGIGRLHHRLGHHRDAAGALVARARELHPGLELADLELRATTVDDGPALVALGRELTARRRGK